MIIEPFRLAQLAAFAAMLASGQLLFKQVALKANSIRDVGSATQLLTHPLFWAALVLYGFATVLWVYLLQRMPLAIAYPFVAGVFALVPIGAWLFFGERLSWSYAVGTALIMAGIVMIGASSA